MITSRMMFETHILWLVEFVLCNITMLRYKGEWIEHCYSQQMEIKNNPPKWGSVQSVDIKEGVLCSLYIYAYVDALVLKYWIFILNMFKVFKVNTLMPVYLQVIFIYK